jgi:FKBP-type peptidyl-prolyl cis-trans isomerase (trigger factor)
MVGAASEKVTRDLRSSFLLDRVAADRKVLVTESETRQEVASLASRYNRSVADMEDYLDRNGLLPAIRGELRERKTLAELRGVVRVVPGEAKAG